MSKIQPLKAIYMDRNATEGAVWGSRVEEDVNAQTVDKESYIFYAKDLLAKAITGN